MKKRITITAWLANFGIIKASGQARKAYVERAASAKPDPVTGMMTVLENEPDPRIKKEASK